jgi:hypothetical protein
MTEHVLQFLEFGAPAEPIEHLASEFTAPFLPALALSASDSPALSPHLLASLFTFREVRTALGYAGLDFVEIADSVVAAEAISAVGDKDSLENGGSGNAAAGLQQEDDGGGEEAFWELDKDDKIDECNAFEVADEVRKLS